MLRLFARLIRDRRAATAVEYGLILALIFIAMLAGFRATSTATVELWGNIGNKVATSR